MFSIVRLKRKKEDLLFYFVLFFLFVLGVYPRAYGLSGRGLEYDEFWSYTHYAHSSLISIFSDLSTPNNHPLNSLLIKLSVAIFSYSTLAIRLPAFIAGVLILPVISYTTYLLTKSRVVAIVSLAIVAFNGGLIHYAQTARGYSLQCLCISLFILLIISLETQYNRSKLLAYTLCLFPILSILTLSTSVMYLFPISLLHIIYLYRKDYNKKIPDKKIIKEFFYRNKPLIISYTVLTFFVVFWYSYNFNAFKAGEYFGRKISSVNDFYIFLKETCFKIASPLIWIMAVLGIIERRWRVWFIRGVAILAVPCIVAVVRVYGPPRVYLPIICILTVMAALGIHAVFKRIKYNKAATLVGTLAIILFLCIQGKYELERWTPTDWGKIAENFYKNVNKNTFITFPANAGLPIFANLKGKAILENVKRLPRGDEHFFLQVGDHLSGTNENKETVSLQLPDRYTIACGNLGEPFRVYELRNLLGCVGTDFSNKEFLFVSILPTGIGDVTALFHAITTSISARWLRCNPCFERILLDESKHEVVGQLLIGKVSKNVDLAPLKNFALKEKKRVQFYFLREPEQ